MTDRRDKVLITSSDYKVGKTVLALSYSNYAKGPKGLCLSFDPERGQDLYVVDKPELANEAELLFYVRRLPTPTLYEVKFLIERIADPERPSKEIRIDRKPVDANQLSERCKAISAEIVKKQLVVNTIILDTVTRLCEHTANVVFESHIERLGLEKAERMSQLIWAKIKDDVSELLFSILEADLNLIMTAWSKNKFDKETMKSTDEMVADVLRNVRAFPDLELMLEPNPPGPKGQTVPPMARVLSSRLKNLPRGSVIKQATWPNIFAHTPQPLEAVPDGREETRSE